MKLSVIIVSWNTLDLTRQSLATLFETAPNIEMEVFVVDNNSADGSAEMVAKEFPQVHLIKNTDNLGFGKANNQALEFAVGEYIMFLNSDVIVHAGAIQRLVEYLDDHRDVMMVGPKLLNVDGTFQHACRRSLPNPVNSIGYLFGLHKLFPKSELFASYKKTGDDPDVTAPVDALSGAAMMFRRDVTDTIGGFDTELFFMYGEDLDFCKRVLDRDWQIVYIHEAKITHLGGQSSKKRRTKSIHNFYDAMWRYYQKHFANHPWLLRQFVRLGITLRHGYALLLNMLKRSS